MHQQTAKQPETTMPSKLADPTAGEAPQNTEHTSADFSPAYLSVLGAALLAVQVQLLMQLQPKVTLPLLQMLPVLMLALPTKQTPSAVIARQTLP
jgi:hypothetical protein